MAKRIPAPPLQMPSLSCLLKATAAPEYLKPQPLPEIAVGIKIPQCVREQLMACKYDRLLNKIINEEYQIPKEPVLSLAEFLAKETRENLGEVPLWVEEELTTRKRDRLLNERVNEEHKIPKSPNLPKKKGNSVFQN